MTAIGGVYAAVFQALNVETMTGAPPTGLGCQVYDDVPQARTFPYIRIGDGTEVNADAFDLGINNGTVRVHVFSMYQGMKQAAAIMDHAEDLLDDELLPVTGHTMFGLYCESTLDLGAEELDGIGKVRHSLQVYRVWTHQ